MTITNASGATDMRFVCADFPRFSVLNNVCILDISDRNPIPIRKDDDVTDPEHTLTEDMFKGFKIRP